MTLPAGNFVEAKVPWRVIATDICGPFPMSKNRKRFLLVAVDLFSKFTVIKAVTNTHANVVVDFIKRKVVSQYACPQIIVCDNGVQYKSELFKDFAKSKGIEIWNIANYFAQGNPTECANKVIGNALKSFLKEEMNHKSWDDHIDEIANAMN